MLMTEDIVRIARTPLTTWWPLGLNSVIEDPAGWQQEEYAWNHTVSLWAIEGPQGYSRVSGPDATRLMSDTCINNFSKARANTIKQVIFCRDDGKIVYDTLCMVIEPGVYELSMYPSRLQWACDKYGSYDVQIEEVPSRTMIQVAGPRSFELLSELTDCDLGAIRYGHFVSGVTFAGVEDVILARFGMTNELGFEIQADFSHLEEIVQRIVEVGEKYGMRKIGVRDHMVQHAEAGQLSIYYGDGLDATYDEGDDYAAYLAGDRFAVMAAKAVPKIRGSYEPKDWSDFYLSPVDVGLTKRIDFSKDFIGKAALENEVANPTRKFVTLEWNKEDVIDVYASMFADGPAHERLDTPHYDYMEIPRDARLPIEASRVLIDGKDVAFTTSRTYLYSFRKMVSNCLMPLAYTEPGTEVTIIWGEPGHLQKEIRATVQTHPYKPFNAKSLPTD